jgi:hypothetical protein
VEELAPMKRLTQATLDRTPARAIEQMDKGGVAVSITSITTPGLWFGSRLSPGRTGPAGLQAGTASLRQVFEEDRSAVPLAVADLDATADPMVGEGGVSAKEPEVQIEDEASGDRSELIGSQLSNVHDRSPLIRCTIAPATS